MRLLRRGWQESLIGAYEKPPAMPEDIYWRKSAGGSILLCFFLFLSARLGVDNHAKRSLSSCEAALYLVARHDIMVI
jgi:hypothetical protein